MIRNELLRLLSIAKANNSTVNGGVLVVLVANKTRASRAGIYRHLNRLIAEGLVEKKPTGGYFLK